MVEFEALDIDGETYLILDRSVVDDEEYLYLSNAEDEEDIMFRKVDKTDNNFIISQLRGKCKFFCIKVVNFS